MSAPPRIALEFFLMKLRMRHCAAIFLVVGSIILASLAWLLVGRLGALAAVGLVILALAAKVWRVRQRPEYLERKRLYLRLDQWISAHSCGDLLDVDGLFVRCCPHLIGPHVRLWPQYPDDRNIRVDEYSLQDLIPGIRHSMLLGTLNSSGELEIPHPTSLRAFIHGARFERDCGVVDTTLAELEGLLDQLDRATPVPAPS